MYILGKAKDRGERTDLHGEGNVGCIDIAVVEVAGSTTGATHGALVKGDEVVLGTEAGVVEVSVQPGGVKEEGMEHDDGGFGLIEAADVAVDGVGPVPEGDIVPPGGYIDVRHMSGAGTKIDAGDGGAGCAHRSRLQNMKEERRHNYDSIICPRNPLAGAMSFFFWRSFARAPSLRFSVFRRSRERRPSTEISRDVHPRR